MNTKYGRLTWVSVVLALLWCVFAIPIGSAQEPLPVGSDNLKQDGEQAAALRIIDAVQAGSGVLPLQDWTPLFAIHMDQPDDGRADRILEWLDFTVKGTMQQHHVLQFGIFREPQPPNESRNKALDPGDTLLYTWSPDGDPIDNGPDGPGISRGDFRYTWYLIGDENHSYELYPNGADDGPQWHIGNFVPDFMGYVAAVNDDGEYYHVAVRTSAYWHNGLELGPVFVGKGNCGTTYSASMWPFFDQDSYEPNFWPTDSCGDDFAPESLYTGNFAVWDLTGSLRPAYDIHFANVWAWPTKLYTTLPEHRRPRWDVAGTAFDFVTGEWSEYRKLFSIENWFTPLGINIHASENSINGPGQLVEANVVITDVGADPYGPSGNGGFDPRVGLENFSDFWTTPAESAVNLDFAYNGCWVWHDTNNDGLFQAPTASEPGVTMAGDYPLFPEGIGWLEEPNERNPGLPHWEYIPLPPGGGDPWWKIKLRFWGGRRRDNPDVTPTGYLEPVGEDDEGQPWHTTMYCDYFVVLRPDSGYEDISRWPGDGTGMTLGSDMRVFIEPRRFNPATGHEDGGIYTSLQMAEDSLVVEGDVLSAWQDDILWTSDEPWWNQRTLNRNNTKPIRSAIEVHDLIGTFETDSVFSKVTYIKYYGVAPGFTSQTFGWPGQTNFDRWLDPFAILADQFFDYYTVGTSNWFVTQGAVNDDWLNISGFHYPYETVPFFDSDFDTAPYGPRSSVYQRPPDQPTLPTYDTWPALLPQGRYPSEQDWEPQYREARHLKQHIESSSRATAMLGFNVTGADDVRVNRNNRLHVEQLTVAFWGPEFTPEDLLELDPLGTDANSGVFVAEDTDRNGVYGSFDGLGFENGVDNPLALNSLEWRENPEPVDLDGDMIADDITGDGIVDGDDLAWVLRIRFKDAWPVPDDDLQTSGEDVQEGGKSLDNETGPADSEALPSKTAIEGGERPVSVPGADYWKDRPVRVDANEEQDILDARINTKAIGPTGNSGDDLFLIVRTSDLIARFEQFKAFVPANLPGRPSSERAAGIQFSPRYNISQGAYAKTHPEEGAVQEYYGTEMIEANVPCELSDLTGREQTIFPGGDPLAVLGIDLSTNRDIGDEPVGTIAEGTQGFGAEAGDGTTTFFVPNAGWTNDAFAGYWLVDSYFESYEITGNNPDTLALLSGRPRNGAWRIVVDPTFLEQIIVEFYDEGDDGKFNILEDLLPLNHEDPLGEDDRFVDPVSGKPMKPVSGVSIYRDNDAHADNRNGIYDPDVDIPVALDHPPYFIGMVGEPDTQVMFVFSSPGTDNIPLPIIQQPRRRQWVPDTFGEKVDDPFRGPDFFVVIRPSEEISVDDDFRVAIVSWGPNTPTEPDPDTFPPPPDASVGSFDVFSEFPWGARAIGLITYFNEQPYYKQYPDEDNSGFNWVRSTVNKAEQSHVIKAIPIVRQPDDVIINSVAPSTVPSSNPDQEITFAISGSGFGLTPTVELDAVDLTVNSSTGTFIDATMPAGQTLDRDGDGVVVLTITNPDTGKKGTYEDLTVTDEPAEKLPRITAITPDTGGRDDFPVTVYGVNFGDPAKNEDPPEVRFGGTLMPVLDGWGDTGVQVAYPNGGLPTTGPQDVTVLNTNTDLEAIALEAFDFENSPTTGCPMAAAAVGSSFDKHLPTFRAVRDRVLLQSAVGAAFVDLYYAVGPALAAQIIDHRWLSVLVRFGLTPLALALEHPMTTVSILGLVGLAAWCYVRRSRRYSHQTLSLREPLMALRKQKGVLLLMANRRIATLATLTLVLLLLATPDALGFYLSGSSTAFNPQLRFYKWALGDMDTNNDGDVSGDDEGIEMTLESGEWGFTLDEMDVVTEAFDVWESVSTSYAAFYFTDAIPDPLETAPEVDGINFVNIAFPGTGIDGEQRAYDAVNGNWAVTVFYTAAEDTFIPSRDGSFSFPVSGGQIFETDIICDGTIVRAPSSDQQPIGDLLGAMVISIGSGLGLGNDTLHNIEFNQEFGAYTEEPAIALRGPDGVLKEVGVTPSMFNFAYYIVEGADTLVLGLRDLAPSDIAAVSTLYPRGNLEEFFSVDHEARTFERPGFPSYPMLGAHIIAWADADNNPSTPRVPFMSTITGLYRHKSEENQVGNFENRGLFRQLETIGEETFQASYTFTVSAIPGADEILQILQSDAGFDTQRYDSTHGGWPLGLTEDQWGVPYEADIYLFPTEVFREGGNLFGLDNRDQGTPLAFDAARRQIVSTTSGKTLDQMLPFTWPMFGEPNMVCPWNIAYGAAPAATGTITTSNGPRVLRALRDKVLLSSTLGTALVDAYYRAAPAMAHFLLRHALALKAARFAAAGLEWTIVNYRIVLAVGLGCCFAAFAWRRRARLRTMAAFLMIVGFLSAVAPPAQALVPLYTTEELVARSDLIVEGTVLSVESLWAERSGVPRGIVTEVTILVTDTMKGRANKNATLQLQLPGGRVGDVIAAVPQLPRFKADEDILLYLRLSPLGTYHLAAGVMSKRVIGKAGDAEDVKVFSTKSLHPMDALRQTVGQKKSESKSSLSLDLHGEPVSDENWILVDDYKDFIRDAVRQQKRVKPKK